MTSARQTVAILMAEDDPEDRLLTEKAFKKAHLANPLRFVGDGEELLAYLRREGDFADEVAYPMPGLILLDLNMPKMDGREALGILKQDPKLCAIPVVVMTTSRSEEDVFRTYGLGASSFITKPVTMEGMVSVVRTFGEYWFEIVRLPSGE